MGESGVEKPWQAYVGIRLRVYGSLLADPERVLSVRYPSTLTTWLSSATFGARGT